MHVILCYSRQLILVTVEGRQERIIVAPGVWKGQEVGFFPLLSRRKQPWRDLGVVQGNSFRTSALQNCRRIRFCRNHWVGVIGHRSTKRTFRERPSPCSEGSYRKVSPFVFFFQNLKSVCLAQIYRCGVTWARVLTFFRWAAAVSAPCTACCFPLGRPHLQACPRGLCSFHRSVGLSLYQYRTASILYLFRKRWHLVERFSFVSKGALVICSSFPSFGNVEIRMFRSVNIPARIFVGSYIKFVILWRFSVFKILNPNTRDQSMALHLFESSFISFYFLKK